ncbi:lysophospholipid acyltransferase family protein [Litorisediminicola beolgyonensis]|uniref:Lysophospholipid acyltransferase family protein n=1 Tax=Litorisediminicola beolgyonensis TaxID=1173614 RepID=A0ABW3ZGN8_9RHOB
MSTRHAARDISYAHSAQTRPGRAMIRLLETASGRGRLIRRAAGYEHEVAAGRDFWQVMIERYGLRLDLVAGALDAIPREGPLVVVANHPYGILDGLILGHLLSQARGDFRILAHRIFRKAADLERIILPIDFDGTREAVEANLLTRNTALDYLGAGGAIGVFPGGTVSTATRPMTRPMDPSWRSFTARMIARSGATVVPVYFEGHNSRLFQMASHLHVTLRMGLLIREFGRRVDKPVRLVIGQPLRAETLAPFAGDARGLMDFLRKATYELSPEPFPCDEIGFEFEDKHRRA